MGAFPEKGITGHLVMKNTDASVALRHLYFHSNKKPTSFITTIPSSFSFSVHLQSHLGLEPIKTVRVLFLLLFWELVYGGSRLWSSSVSGKEYVKTACKLPKAEVHSTTEMLVAIVL